MKGRVSYADTADFFEVNPYRWFASSSDNLLSYINTVGAFTGQLGIQNVSGGTTRRATAEVFTPGLNTPFNLAARYTSSTTRGALDGSVVATQVGVALPDLTGQDLTIAYDFMGCIEEVRIWAVDIGDTGIAEATT